MPCLQLLRPDCSLMCQNRAAVGKHYIKKNIISQIVTCIKCLTMVVLRTIFHLWGGQHKDLIMFSTFVISNSFQLASHRPPIRDPASMVKTTDNFHYFHNQQ